MVKKYGLPMLVTSDDSLKEYLTTVLSQVQGMSHQGPMSAEMRRSLECNGLTLRMAHVVLYQPPSLGHQIGRIGRNAGALAIRNSH